MKRVVRIYTDGSCLSNPGAGGYCAIMQWGPFEKVLTGGESNSTNNRMELTAVVEAISAVKNEKDISIDIYSDSQYVVSNAMSVSVWKKNGWRTKYGKIKNVDLWQRFESEMAKRKDCYITFNKIPAHSGVVLNERCDGLAKAAAERFR